MIKSMTGFGQAEGLVCGLGYAVEIKTVNNRYLRTEIRVPERFAFVQDDVERLIKQYVLRGTVNYCLRPRDPAATSACLVDDQALKDIAARLDRIRSSLPGSAGISIDMATLLTLPQVARAPEPFGQEVEQAREQILAISRQALERLGQMRASEGQFLCKELLGYCDEISALLDRIDALRGQAMAGYAQRLRKRADELLCQANCRIDDQVVAREVAIIAERSDVTEEVARLRSHLQQFRHACGGEGQVGRRLDFLGQEMFREANTIASKALDAETAAIVVDIKCHIDRIKEQVQNVE